ncbi:MAG: response regulator [Halofilum sp. (in: g-proteobacteria)]|nr:response regulator [Halofilum sp. (in: g-proteobacteria)]
MPQSQWASEVRRSQELQSGLVRLVAWLAMGGFVGIAGLRGHYDVAWDLYFWLFGLHLVWFVALLGDVLRRPALRPWRTYLAIAADLSAITLLIYLAGAVMAPFYLVYVLSFLSQGTRFGRTNLMIASVGSLACYGVIVTVMGGWAEHAFELGFVLAALVVLPLYQYSLLRNLQQARTDAEIASRARGRFLATMAHELRTPLSGAVGTARLLGDTELDATQRRYVESICSSADTLQALIGDILDLSKVDAGTLELEQEPFDLGDALIEVCDNLAPQALAKGIELVCCIDGRLPERVRGDRVRCQQILYNLLGNAVKFTDAGRVRLEAARVRGTDEPGGGHVLLVVSDTGIGIPAERVDRVFDGFWQADPTTARRHGGAGLGTTIAHRLVQAMGGRVEVESSAGSGSTFRVRLPLLSGDPAADAPPRPPRALGGREALVWERDPESLAARSEACAGAGVDARGWCDAELPPAAQLARADVVLVADTVAGLEIEDLVARLRARAGRQRLPVVPVRFRGRAAGDDDAITRSVAKPLQPRALWQALAEVLGAAGPAPAGRRAAPAPPEVAARILVTEDDPVNAELIETLLARAGHRVRVVRDGPSALEALAGEAFDLVLADLRMPGMDGAELARRIRAAGGEAGRLPIVALTANAADEARADCLRAGMDDFLTKPIDLERLTALLQRFAPA